MEQMQNSKTGKVKLIFSIILFFLAFIPLILSIYLFCHIVNYSGREQENLIGNSIFFLVLTEVIMGGALVLNWSYRSHVEGKPKVLSTVFFVLNVITVIPLAIVILVLFVIRKIWIELMNNADVSSSSSSSDKTYTITDERGYTQTLEWDKYTKTYRDSYGHHYETKDGGKTFRRKK